MPTIDRFAVMLDGEFVKKVLHKRLKHFPTAAEVMGEVARIFGVPELASLTLYRVFYYTAEPLSGTAVNPLDGSKVDFSKTAAFSDNTKLIDTLDNQPDVAVRRGVLAHQGWEIGRSAAKALLRKQKTAISAGDLQPKIQQKGVDMRIGLDIASLALKRLVGTVVVVTGDSDMVPAMKLARREGLRVFLDALGHPVRPELKVHADRII